jgi:hypothetical protein
VWRAGEHATAFGMAGAVDPVVDVRPENPDFSDAAADDLARFDLADAGPRVVPAVDASDNVDVVVPVLLPGDDAAWVALYAFFPGRGLVPLALRFVDDTNGDGLVDADGAPSGVVTLFVPPSLWTARRPLVALAGSGKSLSFRQGRLSTERSAAVVVEHRVTLPAFASSGTAIVDGARVVLPPRNAGELVAIDGTKDGATARVYVSGSVTDVDTGLDTVSRVWAVTSQSSPASFATGSGDVPRFLALPSTTRALFGGD